jgi:hypothetical protein
VARPSRSEGPPPHLRPHGPHPRDGKRGKGGRRDRALGERAREGSRGHRRLLHAGNCYLKEEGVRQGGRVLPRNARQASRSRLTP